MARVFSRFDDKAWTGTAVAFSSGPEGIHVAATKENQMRRANCGQEDR